MRALLCLLAAAALASPARGAEGRLAVVPLEAPPDLTFMGRSVAEAFAAAAAKEGGEVLAPAAVEAKLGRAATQALVACADDARCLAAKGAALGVDRLVGGWLRKRGEAYRVALVHADARSGERLGGLEREIPVAARRLQKDVAAAAPGLLAGGADASGVLKVVTDVPGAAVTVDDVGAGTTPLARTVRPGRHKVHVSGEGFQDATPVWVEVPANGVVEHRPRLYQVPARDRSNRAAPPPAGTSVEVVR
jgi:PEGA domain-containing protein